MKNNLNIKLDDSTNSSTSDSAKPAADIWKEYYENGQIKCETPLVNVEKHGVEKWYYESGELKRESPFTNSKRHGILKEYYKNGQIKEESLYDNSELKGTNNYDENGQIIVK